MIGLVGIKPLFSFATSVIAPLIKLYRAVLALRIAFQPRPLTLLPVALSVGLICIPFTLRAFPR